MTVSNLALFSILFTLSAPPAFAKTLDCQSEPDERDGMAVLIEGTYTKNKLYGITITEAFVDDGGFPDPLDTLEENFTLDRDENYVPRSKKYRGYAKYEASTTGSHSIGAIELLLPEQLLVIGDFEVGYLRISDEHSGLTMNETVYCRVRK